MGILDSDDIDIDADCPVRAADLGPL